MSKFVVYLKLQPFVAQWLHHHYGNPVQFQPKSVENSTILQFTQKLPEGRQPDTAADGLTAVCIPDNEKKDPSVYNYLGPKGKEAVVDCIERTFKLMMWSELNDMSDVGCSVLGAIDAWCEMHGIDIEYDRTILMRYNRIRNSYVKKGVDLRRSCGTTISCLTKNNSVFLSYDRAFIFTGHERPLKNVITVTARST